MNLFLLQDYSGYTNPWELLGLIVIFLLVIAACYFVTRFVGGKQMLKQKNSNFTVLETFRLTQNKYLQLIQIGKKYIVLAVGKDSVTFLTELSEEDITFHFEQNGSNVNFAEILKKIKKDESGQEDKSEEIQEKDD